MSAARPLSIVHLVDNLDSGGLERVAIDLAIAQQKAGHRVAFVCLQHKGVLAEQAESAGIPVTAMNKPLGLTPGVVRRIRAELRARRADVLHMHNPGVHLYGVLAAKLAGVPAIVNTRHGTHKSTGEPFDERFFRRLLRWTGKVVYVGRQTELYFSGRSVPASKGAVVWNGVRLEKFLSAPSPRPDRGRVRFITAGRLVPVKEHGTLIAAFATVAGTCPTAELCIRGEGPLRGTLERQVADLGLSGRVRLPGNTDDIASELAAADVFVFSSSREGLPMVILEAMGAGLPIVSTRVGDVPDVAPEGEVAWYSPVNDVAALAQAMIAAAADPSQRARRGVRARQLATERYSIETCRQGYEKVYRELIPS